MSATSLAHRLIKINNYFIGGKVINILELSEEFSISQRQIQKDIELFKGIYEIKSLGNQNYTIEDRCKEKNTQSLQFSALFDIEEDKSIFILDTVYEEITRKDEFYKLIKAIKNKESCSFLYTKKDGSFKKVFVHPYKLANFSNFWYLIAYDVEYKKLKSYYVNGIEKIEMAGENYINNVAIEKEIENTFVKFNSVWFDGDVKSVELKITGKAKLYIKRNLPKQANIMKETQEVLYIEFEYYNKVEVLSFVKQWLPEIKILNNDELSNDLKNILKKFLDEL